MIRFCVSPAFNLELNLIDLQNTGYPELEEQDLKMGFCPVTVEK